MSNSPEQPAGASAEPSVAEVLAADFLARDEAGGQPQLVEWSRQLQDAPDRAEFRQLVQDALGARDSLPRPVRAGVVVGGLWRIEEELGSGGTGLVYKALDLRTGSHVALKILTAAAGRDLAPQSRFVIEARALAAFAHKRIVAVQDFGNDGDLRFLVSKLVKGASFDELLRRVRLRAAPGTDGGQLAPRSGRALTDALTDALAGPLTPEGLTLAGKSWWKAVATLVSDAAATVEAAHACGVAHRGLKPGNLMLRADGTVVVLDFGLEGTLEHGAAQLERGLFGRADFGVPERAHGETTADPPRADIYQLGLVLHELLTLHRAFDGRDVRSTLRQIDHGGITPPRAHDARIPPELDAICTKATELAPERRYPTMHALHADLQLYLDGRKLPVAVRDSQVANSWMRARYALRRHRGPILIAVTGLLVAAALAGSLRGG